MQLSNQSWCIHGSLSYGSPPEGSTVNCYSNVDLINSAISAEVVNAQYFRAGNTGAGLTSPGYLAACMGHVVMNSASQTSGSLYGFRSRIDNLAGTLSEGVAYHAELGFAAIGETVTQFTGFEVIAPANYGTITTYGGISIGTPNGTVTNSYGVSIADLAGTENAIGVLSELSAGTGRYNLYCLGTARNYLAGKTSFGADVDGEMFVTSEDGYALKDGITAPAALTGYAKIFIDTSGGDLKITYGDGVTKTIVVDT